MKKALIIVGVIIVIAVLVVVNLGREGSKIEIDVASATPRTIIKTVTASGRVQATRQVNVSASAMGKVTRVAIEEGDYVEAGDFLLQIDATGYQTAVDQLEASIRSAQATLEMEEANLRKAEYDLARSQTLYEQDVVSDETLRTAKLNVEVTRARVKSAQESLEQYRANLKKAAHDLEMVRITADISGVVTSLNVEEGENAIMGTLNNPGTVLLVIADLSQIETEVEVDETEVVFVRVGQEASISLDAYPDRTFAGVVTEVGNSAIRTQVGLGQSSVDFKVVISVVDSIPNVRPGLSASAKIEVRRVDDALSIPIQCLTIRQQSDLPSVAAENDTVSSKDPNGDDTDVEGVFVVEGGVVSFRAVEVGIAGSRYFEVLNGLERGDVVVKGPFKAINELKDGDRVKVTAESSKEE